MTKLNLQRKTINKENNSKSKNLSIQFSLDGFSFSITDITSKEIIHFSEYIFEESLATPQILLEKITAIFKEDPFLQQDFTSVSVLHQNNLSTIVPTDLFDENNIKSYLKYTIKTLATDFIAFDDITSIYAKNVYVPYININNYLFQNFGEFEYKHHTTVLIDKLIEYTKDSIEKQFFVHVSKKQLDIVVLENKTLLFYNSFSFETKEDFIYYILFTAEQLQMNPDEFLLTFSGNIEEDTELYEITYNYIRNIKFTTTKVDLFNNSTDFSQHSNYILVS